MTVSAGIILSDLDGTFLDARGRPALTPGEFAQVLARWHVVWVSSRTAEELLHLQRALGHTGDAIGEDGGVVLSHDHAVATALGHATALGRAWVVRRATPHAMTAARVRRAFAGQNIAATTLDDLGAKEFARREACTVDAAERALHRRASVLLAGVDHDDLRAQRAMRTLRAEGCSVARGGRWLSVVHGADKGTTASAWLAARGVRHPDEFGSIVAIGNADNDESLLRGAHMAFVVRAPDGAYATRLTAIPDAHLLRRPGTAGWPEMCECLDALAERAS